MARCQPGAGGERAGVRGRPVRSAEQGPPQPRPRGLLCLCRPPGTSDTPQPRLQAVGRMGTDPCQGDLQGPESSLPASEENAALQEPRLDLRQDSSSLSEPQRAPPKNGQ